MLLVELGNEERMVQLTTRIEEVFWIEDFKIRVRDSDDEVVPNGLHGILEKYPFTQRLADAKSVADWIRLRFCPSDESYSCEVLCGDGKVARESAVLAFVRDTYV